MKFLTLALLLTSLSQFSFAETEPGPSAVVCRDDAGNITKVNLGYVDDTYVDMNKEYDLLTYAKGLDSVLSNIDGVSYPEGNISKDASLIQEAFTKYISTGENSPIISFQTKVLTGYTVSVDGIPANCKAEKVSDYDFDRRTYTVRGDLIKMLDEKNLKAFALDMTLWRSFRPTVGSHFVFYSFLKKLVNVPVKHLNFIHFIKLATPEVQSYKKYYNLLSGFKVLSEDEVLILDNRSNIKVILNGNGEFDREKTLEKGRALLSLDISNWDKYGNGTRKLTGVCSPTIEMTIKDRDGRVSTMNVSYSKDVDLPFGRVDLEFSYPKFCIPIPIIEAPLGHSELKLYIHSKELAKFENIKLSPLKKIKFQVSFETALDENDQLTIH